MKWMNKGLSENIYTYQAHGYFDARVSSVLPAGGDVCSAVEEHSVQSSRCQEYLDIDRVRQRHQREHLAFQCDVQTDRRSDIFGHCAHDGRGVEDLCLRIRRPQ